MESILKVSLFIISVVISIIFAYVTEKSKQDNYNRMFEDIENSVDSNNANNKEILEAFKHESGTPFFIKSHSDGSSLEYYVFKCLYRLKGKTLTDLYIPKKKGLTQIDNLLIHPTGIYVIECKDWRAKEIQGNERFNKWKCTYNNNTIKEYYNPLKQNFTHSTSLRDSISYKNVDNLITSIIVLGSDNYSISYSQYKDGINQYVFSKNEFKSKIQELFSNRKEVLSDEDIINIYKEVHYKYSNVKSTVKKKHLNQVQEIISKREAQRIKRA